MCTIATGSKLINRDTHSVVCVCVCLSVCESVVSLCVVWLAYNYHGNQHNTNLPPSTEAKSAAQCACNGPTPKRKHRSHRQGPATPLLPVLCCTTLHCMASWPGMDAALFHRPIYIIYTKPVFEPRLKVILYIYIYIFIYLFFTYIYVCTIDTYVGM